MENQESRIPGILFVYMTGTSWKTSKSRLGVSPFVARASNLDGGPSFVGLDFSEIDPLFECHSNQRRILRGSSLFYGSLYKCV